MPLARISHEKTLPQEEVDRISKDVHHALMEAFTVPEEDYFQIVTPHTAESELRITPAFLGVDHTNNALFIQLTVAEGRTVEQKRALYAKIASSIGARGHVRPQDVIINLIEVKRENWSFGNGLAHYALAS